MHRIGVFALFMHTSRAIDASNRQVNLGNAGLHRLYANRSAIQTNIKCRHTIWQRIINAIHSLFRNMCAKQHFYQLLS